MIVAELEIVPVGNGSSMKEPVQKAVEAIRRTGIKYEVGAVATTLEARDFEDILDAVQAAHDAACAIAPRVKLVLNVDHRMDKRETTGSLASAAQV